MTTDETVQTVAKALARAHDKLQHQGRPTALLAYDAGSIAVLYWDTLAKAALRARTASSTERTGHDDR